MFDSYRFVPGKSSFIINEESFASLYTDYWSDALSLARQLAGDDFAAEDIVQNIFISLWKRKDTLRIEVPVQHFLKRAVKFAAAAYIRDKVRKETLSLDSIDALATSDADAPILHKELVKSLTGFVNQLPDRSQKVYYMRFTHALDNPDISSSLGISEKTVRNQLSLTLKRIRDYLTAEGYSSF